MRTVHAHRAIRLPAQRQVVSHPTRAGRASCMRQRILHTATALVHTYSTRPAPWNRPPRRHSRHPSAEGNFTPRRYVSSSPPLEGWAQPGVVRDFKNTHLLPLVFASNKKVLRAYRPQTYCTGLPQSYANVFNVGVALHNDRGRVCEPRFECGMRTAICNYINILKKLPFYDIMSRV